MELSFVAEMLKLAILLTCAVAAVVGQERLQVNIRQGSLSGIRISPGLGRPQFWAFRGIPYAEPPVGALRFRNPVAHRGWSGVRDASTYGASCPHQPAFGIILPGSDENCLFLNVYTPSNVGNRPVMVWIHGGGFIWGDGNSLVYGPEFLVNDGGVVVVTINYRLGVMGFLSTNDGAAQGNWALKDMVEALRWVRENIQSFGGNPNSVTIFGESAGAVGVHYLLLSQMGSGLFNRAIVQSGTANLPWGLHTNPAAEAAALGRRLGLSWTTNQDLINQIRNVPWRTVLAAQAAPLPDFPRGLGPNPWIPNVEPVSSPEARFLTNTPINILTTGSFLRVPLIMGYTSDECLYIIPEMQVDSTVFNQFAQNPHLWSPISFNLNRNTQQAQINEVATTFRNFYLNGQQPNAQNIYNFTQYYTDHIFSHPTDRAIRLHAQHQTQPIFYYKFSFDGALNMLKRLSGLGDFPGAMHADDLFYLFDVTNFPMPILPNNHAIQIRRRMVRMWTNFATFGDPTPVVDALISTRWQRYTTANQNFLDIGDESVNMSPPQSGRLQQWHNFQNRFNPSG